MRKFFLVFLLTLTQLSHAGLIVGNNVNADVNNPDYQITDKMMQYNGAIIGYAQACNLSKSDYMMLDTKFLKVIGEKNVFYNSAQMKNLRTSYDNAKDMASKQKNSISKAECSIFESEFKKIIENVKKY